MPAFLEGLKERKVVQWALAYLAGAWVCVEAVDVLGDIFDVPVGLQRGAVVLLAFGFVIALIVAWYHGEQGRQRVSGSELLIVAGVLVVAGATLSRVGDRPRDDGPPVAETAAGTGSTEAGPYGSDETDVRSIAVLPFADLSPEGDQEYFGDGVAEELLGALSQLDGLRVASRTSSFAFKGQRLDVREIGRRLGVGAVIEGSVNRSGERLRVNARLVSVEGGFRLWSERFDTEARDIFAIQDSIARSVAQALQVRLAGGERELVVRGQTTDHRAQELYLQGRYAWNRRTREGLDQAVRYFEAAVERDSLYARALVGLADAYAVQGFYDYRPPREAFPPAQAAARRALAIDSTLAEPHATLGYAALYYDWDWEAAEREFLRSLELDPGYPVAHQWYANFLVARGRFDEAEREMRAASELDPLSSIAFTAVGWVHFYARAYERAVRQLEDAAERDPDFELAYLWNGQVHEALGRLARAETLIARAVELSNGSALTRAALARTYALQGRVDESRAILAALVAEGEGGYVPSYEIARVHVGLGDADAAITWLERAMEERAHSMAFLREDPQLDPLHEHPGYRRLLERMGLSDP